MPPGQLRAHFETLLAAVPETAVILQYAPAETGSSLELSLLAELAGQYPNLWGVKVDASPAGPAIAAVAAISKKLGRPFRSTVGYAGLHLVDGVARGTSGVQPGCSATELYVALWRLLTGPDPEAGVRLHQRMLPYLAHWMQSVELIVAAEKEISRRRGWIATGTVRRPGYVLDGIEHARIDRFLAEFADLLR